MTVAAPKPISYYYESEHSDGTPAGKVFTEDAGYLGLRQPLYALTDQHLAALNAHDALVEALTKIVAMPLDEQYSAHEMRATARAALAKAKP